GIQRLDRTLRRFHLGLSERLRRMDDLSLQIRLVDDVGVDDADPAHSRRSEIERGGGAEAAGPDQQNLRVEQLQLALLADLGDQQVAAVTGTSRRVQPSL